MIARVTLLALALLALGCGHPKRTFPDGGSDGPHVGYACFTDGADTRCVPVTELSKL